MSGGVRPTLEVNLQSSMGPAGVEAVNSRCVAERLISSATDDIKKLVVPGTLRCCNCGLAVDESLKLGVRDVQDPIVRGAGARDYVRIPLNFDELRHSGGASFEYSDYVACTPPCALRYMYDSPDFVQSHVPDLFAKMMWLRHRQDEPVNAAPNTDCLAYLYRSDEKKNGSVPGLSASSFYWLLATPYLIGYRQMAPLYIPPLSNEHLALAEKNHRFTQYYYQESSAGQTGPPQVGAKLPLHIPSFGVKLDANPDADHETDFATDTVHPPPEK